MKELYLIVVGKLKSKHLEHLEHDYQKRINSPKLKILEAKSHEENLDKEANEIVKKIKDISGNSKYTLIILKEEGEQYSSISFSKFLKGIIEESSIVIFVIGGASGHGEAVLNLHHQSLSLSEMTFPHKLARLLLIEQIYRAQTINCSHPYHK